MARSVDAYAEYQRIVGGDDKGRLFSDSEYEAYKKRVTPLRVNNRMFVSWQNKDGMDCKLIGPETKCLCQCRFKRHQTDVTEINQKTKKIPCSDCGCKGFTYVPANGPRQMRCGRCKCEASVHNAKAAPYKCQKCSKCPGFMTAARCSCGKLAPEHRLVVESKEERIAAGKPVGIDCIYKAMGGITGFSSLLDGAQRLDPSGLGDFPSIVAAYKALE